MLTVVGRSRRGKGVAVSQSPGKTAVTLEMVAQLVRQGSWQQAFDTLEAQLQSRPEDPNLHSAAAAIALHQWLLSVHDNQHLFDAATSATQQRAAQTSQVAAAPAHQLRRHHNHSTSMPPPPPRFPRRHAGSACEGAEGQPGAQTPRGPHAATPQPPTATGRPHPHLHLSTRTSAEDVEVAAMTQLLKGREGDKLFHMWHLLGQRLSTCTIPSRTQHFAEVRNDQMSAADVVRNAALPLAYHACFAEGEGAMAFRWLSNT